MDGCVGRCIVFPQLVYSQQHQPLNVSILVLEWLLQELSCNPFQGSKPAQNPIGQVHGMAGIAGFKARDVQVRQACTAIQHFAQQAQGGVTRGGFR